MSFCSIDDGSYCQCQPDEGTGCLRMATERERIQHAYETGVEHAKAMTATIATLRARLAEVEAHAAEQSKLITNQGIRLMEAEDGHEAERQAREEAEAKLKVAEAEIAASIDRGY